MKSASPSESSWRQKALCSSSELSQFSSWFFSENPEERSTAKRICHECPVRRECLDWALENRQIWGVWGGRDESQNRRTLAITKSEEETRKRLPSGCPYCHAPPSRLRSGTVDLPSGGRWSTARVVVCGSCGFSWKSRYAAASVEMYLEDRSERISGTRKKIRSGCINRASRPSGSAPGS